MPDYHVFGGVFRATIEFPELPSVAGRDPRWWFSQVDQPTPTTEAQFLGREPVDQNVTVSLFSIPGGLRLVFDDTGTFDILEGGRRIAWAAPTAPDLDAVRKDVLGRVFAVALAQSDILTLHGSAVALGEGAVAFLAPKFHGKSTTATALVNAGAKLLADDLVAVAPGLNPMVLPSVPLVQLWKDSAERVAGHLAPSPGEQSIPKLQVAWKGDGQYAQVAVPLAAIYLLAPVRPDAPGGVRRLRVTGVEAALALLGQAKVGALLGVGRRAVLLQELADLAGRVPVFRVEIPRDFDRLEELTSCFLSWHRPSTPTSLPGVP